MKKIILKTPTHLDKQKLLILQGIGKKNSRITNFLELPGTKAIPGMWDSQF